ncbi:MAG: hypothetical protein KA354_24025 [Phycisphaerae bacterium]|nr:hypothetical protein [Phycisphaerae bacterium]
MSLKSIFPSGLLWLCGVSVLSALGQPIDFETYPDSTPTRDEDVISDQYASRGILFELVNRTTGQHSGFPRIAEVGKPRTAFVGCLGQDTPREGQSLGSRFLTDSLSLGATGDLLITYLTPVSDASGVIIDVDCRNNGGSPCEQWTLIARDEAGNELERVVIDGPEGPRKPECLNPEAGPGDGVAFGWAFERPRPDISSILLRYTGEARRDGAGLAFDLFSPGAPPPPLTVEGSAWPLWVWAGEFVTLSGEASGGWPPYEYAWQKELTNGTWITVASSPTADVAPGVETRYRLTVTDALNATATSSSINVLVCPVLVEVSQESAPDVADFDSHLLGTIGLYATDLTTATYYGSGSFRGPAPLLTLNRSHLFMLAAADGLALVVVHDIAAENGGGRAEMQFDLEMVLAQLLVRDDTTSEDAYLTEALDSRLLSRHVWSSPHTDGLALGSLAGDWTIFVQFSDWSSGGPTIGGLDSWVAYGPDDTMIPLALAENRRVRLRAVRGSFPDSDGDGVIDPLDLCPDTVPHAAIHPDGCPMDILGDFDRDGDVDTEDFEAFESCASGPAVHLQPGCEAKDVDRDNDVDQSDFGAFQRCYSGTDRPARVGCEG